MPLPFDQLHTARLSLRPVRAADAGRFAVIQADWNVTRMLRMAPWPPDPSEMAAWLAAAPAEWVSGTAHRFAVIYQGTAVGCVDVDEIEGGWGSLGYWLEASAWGLGLASEAAARMRDFAFDTVGLEGLYSGHASDNPASGKVLTRLGFARTGEELRWSRPRNALIPYVAYRLKRPSQP